MALFRNTQKLTNEKEDHLTEFFAASLNASDSLKVAFVQLVFGEHVKKHLIKVETQSSYPNCRPDMKLIFDDGSVILCENKLEALETTGNELTEFKLQLERYLQLPVDGVMYIRSRLKSPSQKVLGHAKYIKPIDKPHFLWRDFYAILEVDNNSLVKELKLGFEVMGFIPPNPVIGDLSREAPKSHRENFSHFWLETEVEAMNLGWKVSVGDIVERYFSHPTAKFASDIYINPIHPERFLVRLTPRTDMHERLFEEVKLLNSHVAPAVKKHTIKRANGVVTVIDIETTINAVLPNSLNKVEEIESALLNYVLPYLKLG